MTKRNILLAFFSILVFLSVIYFLPLVNGYDFIFIDAEDDVYRYCESTDETDIGDYHDELDIVKLNITGKYVSFTVVGNISDWDSYYRATVFFSSHFTWYEQYLELTWRSPCYIIEFHPKTRATLEKIYHLEEGGYAYEVWNGTAWENSSTATPANILSEISQHSLTAHIPDAVEEIPSNMKCLLWINFWETSTDCTYADIAPSPSNGGGNVPSYNIFVLICAMIGISIFLVRKRSKLK
ncbi:MAG: hypothetical protein ACFE9T_10655 [Promethearchaeota archaeon]